MAGRTLLVVLGVALAVSAGAALVALREARRTYVEMLTVRLDPASSGRFVPLNAALPAKAPGEVRVVLFGDSRMERWAEPPEVPRVRFVNRGEGGDTTAQALARLERDVIDLGADVCVVQCGVNDLKAIGVLPERADEIRRGCVDRLRALVARLTARGVRVVLLTVLPSSDVPLVRRPLWSAAVDDAIAAVNVDLRTLAGPLVRVVDCDPAFRSGSRLVPSFAADQLHLNPAGYAALAELVRPVLVEEAGR